MCILIKRSDIPEVFFATETRLNVLKALLSPGEKKNIACQKVFGDFIRKL